jgi:hypothetical protein
MTTLAEFVTVLAGDRSLAVLVTTHPEQRDPQISVVNAAVIHHPSTGLPVLSFVGRTGSKLRNLRANPRATLVARSGWEWCAATGPVELIGPDDPHPNIGGAALTALLRDIYHAAGGHHPNLDAYDEAMRAEHRCAVLLSPDRIWSNPSGSEHLEPTQGTQ